MKYSEKFLHLLKQKDIRITLSKKDFKSLYNMIEEPLIPQFTNFCYEVLRVDPLEYMDYIPKKFLYKSEIKKFIIPDTIRSIGNYAFEDCSSLTDIEIPYSVEIIGNHAFEDCSSLTNIKIPNSVTSIGGYAFNGCKSLKNIIISDSVTEIASRTFWYCDSLENITIPNGVTRIGSDAFGHCYSLKNIEIPVSVREIGTVVFASCRLVTVKYNGTKRQHSDIHHWGPLTDTGRLIKIICTDGEKELC